MAGESASQESSMLVSGGCLCGAVRYEIEAERAMPELSVVATAQSTSPVHAAVGGLIALAVAIGKMKRIAILP